MYAAMDRRVWPLVTGWRDLGTSRTPQPCSNAHAAPRDSSGSIAEALCAGFPTIVRRRFGELRPGSAGLVIAKECLNRGPEGANVMHFGGELNRVLGELRECKPRARRQDRERGLLSAGLVIPGDWAMCDGQSDVDVDIAMSTGVGDCYDWHAAYWRGV
jgi:hypothetical protein